MRASEAFLDSSRILVVLTVAFGREIGTILDPATCPSFGSGMVLLPVDVLTGVNDGPLFSPGFGREMVIFTLVVTFAGTSEDPPVI